MAARPARTARPVVETLRRGLAVKILLSEEQLRQGVDRLAGEVAAAWGPHPMTIVGVLTGCVVFLADLIRRLDMPLRIDLLQASSYRGRTTRGELTVDVDLRCDLQGRHVLVVDDIYDTGHTLREVLAALEKYQAASIRTAVLLRKEGRQQVDLEPDFVAFHIPDQFVVGYGLDYADEYRNLPYLAALEPADLEPSLERSGGAAGR